MASTTPAHPRLPLNTLGVAFGLAGLSGTWTTATALGAPEAVGEFLWVTAAVAWITTLTLYGTRISHLREVVEDLLRRYLRLPFALGFWAFTFTTAAGATYGVRLLTLGPSPLRTIADWLLIALATGIIGAVGIRSLALLHLPRHIRAARVQHT
ncbi:hypothetical protein GCM10010517_63150 [Streptosporangium fragile]|uniref:C4-dicarboxylate ABC transporter n=1 Tax=Streptosporangium fragile TaxID=46186 RepID=A0ABN3W5B6_9ACTN